MMILSLLYRECCILCDDYIVLTKWVLHSDEKTDANSTTEGNP